eukprot:CAMPEP_0171159398 /NCGR_PEP_ID=MMETSP0790-20130122/3019_1 /TAXON_ID=2925 /ORGANISM="Alexandrium catenella, Strain OF101" /LENGTH=760 /DNA_ID=CAMNT_0011623895 /DNA_START=94 /DNA_END=2377 /DNA_ORIENTATION=-
MGCGASAGDEFRYDSERNVRVDLAGGVINMIFFLDTVDQHPCLYLNKNILKAAIQRYEQIWLPLLASLPEKQQSGLVPPLDVEWVWHCHMLAPKAYEADLRKVLGTGMLIDHRLLTPSQRTAGRSKAKALWEKQDKQASAIFDIEPQLQAAPLREEIAWESPTPSRLEYDIADAAARQMSFHYQVAVMPHYRDYKFLHKAADRYIANFLELKKRFPAKFWVPTYDIDACWHAHMLHPKDYAAETEKLAGQVLNHDDSVNDRTEGSKLTSCWEETVETWRRAFAGAEAARAGGMFRGNVTAEERAVRDQVQKSAKQVVDGVTEVNIVANMDMMRVQDVQQAGSAVLGGGRIACVHEHALRRALEAGSEDGRAAVVERRGTFNTRTAAVQTRVVHAFDPSGDRSATAVEVWSGIQPFGEPPIATAHRIGLDQLPTRGDLQYANRCAYLGKGEVALLLRFAGEDLAVLVGAWQGLQMPLKGTPGIPGDKDQKRRGIKGKAGKPGQPGSLSMRLAPLKTAKCQAVALQPSRNADSRIPPSYALDMAVLGLPGVGGPASVNVSTSTVRCSRTALVPTALIAMGIGVLHVLLQPRFKASNASEASSSTRPGFSLVAPPPANFTLYPVWTTEQRKYALLVAAGGEATQTVIQVVGVPVARTPQDASPAVGSVAEDPNASDGLTEEKRNTGKGTQELGGAALAGVGALGLFSVGYLMMSSPGGATNIADDQHRDEEAEGVGGVVVVVVAVAAAGVVVAVAVVVELACA